METPLAEGQIKYQTTYHLSTPPEPEIVSCHIDKAKLFPVLLNQREVLVYGCYTTAVCYSYTDDQGKRHYQLATQAHNLIELIPLQWQREVKANPSTANFRLEVRSPESWQCWAEPPVEEKKQAGQGFSLLTSFFTPRPRNLVVSVAGIIAVKVFPQKNAPEKPPPEEEKNLPSAAVSPTPDYPPPPSNHDKLLQMLLEILFSQERLSPGKATEGVEAPPSPWEGPTPIAEVEGTGIQREKGTWKGLQKIPPQVFIRGKALSMQPIGKKISLPAGAIQPAEKQGKGPQGRRSFSTVNILSSPKGPLSKDPKPSRQNKAEPKARFLAKTPLPRKTWPNLAKLNPGPKEPLGNSFPSPQVKMPGQRIKPPAPNWPKKGILPRTMPAEKPKDHPSREEAGKKQGEGKITPSPNQTIDFNVVLNSLRLSRTLPPSPSPRAPHPWDKGTKQ